MKTTIKIIVLTITAAFVLSRAFARGQDAKPRTPTPAEAAYSWKLGVEINNVIECNAGFLTAQQELIAAKAKIKELESDLAEASAFNPPKKPEPK